MKVRTPGWRSRSRSPAAGRPRRTTRSPGMYGPGPPGHARRTIAQFQFVNPHPFVMVEVTDAKGVAQTWKAELDKPVGASRRRRHGDDVQGRRFASW